LHGLRQVVRRGLANVSIQVYLTAMVMNLKRLAAFILLFFGYLMSDRPYKYKLNPLWQLFRNTFYLLQNICLDRKITARRKFYATFSTAPSSLLLFTGSLPKFYPGQIVSSPLIPFRYLLQGLSDKQRRHDSR